MEQFLAGMDMKNNLNHPLKKKYYQEISPVKRREILFSEDFIHSFTSQEEYERVNKIFHIRHAQDETLKIDRLLWNCVHLLELYVLKTKRIIKHIVKSEQYEVFDSLNFTQLINEKEFEDAIFNEFINTFYRYASTIKPTRKAFFGLKQVPQDVAEKLHEDIWKMSEGITQLTDEKRKILSVWNDAAEAFLQNFII